MLLMAGIKQHVEPECFCIYLSEPRLYFNPVFKLVMVGKVKGQFKTVFSFVEFYDELISQLNSSVDIREKL